jgi:magnesium-transporting ATPase (P-type)
MMSEQELLVGDLVLLKNGDITPANMVLIKGKSVKAMEVMNGNTVTVRKAAIGTKKIDGIEKIDSFITEGSMITETGRRSEAKAVVCTVNEMYIRMDDLKNYRSSYLYGFQAIFLASLFIGIMKVSGL